MIGAAKRKSISPPGLSALWSILLLVVALCLPETRVWGFGISTPPASGVFESASPSSIGENTIAWRYDASGSPVAHLRELIDRETGRPGATDLTVEEAWRVFRDYNGSGRKAEKYADDAVAKLLNAAQGTGQLYFFERR